MRGYKRIAALIVIVGGFLGLVAFLYEESKETTYVSSAMLRIPADLPSDLVLPMYRVASESSSKANVLLSGNAVVLTYVSADPEAASVEVSRVKAEILGAGREVAEHNSEDLNNQRARVDQAIEALSNIDLRVDSLSVVSLMTLMNQIAQRGEVMADFDRWIIEQKSNKVETRKLGSSPLIVSVVVFVIFVSLGFCLLYVRARSRNFRKVEISDA